MNDQPIYEEQNVGMIWVCAPGSYHLTIFTRPAGFQVVSKMDEALFLTGVGEIFCGSHIAFRANKNSAAMLSGQGVNVCAN